MKFGYEQGDVPLLDKCHQYVKRGFDMKSQMLWIYPVMELKYVCFLSHVVLQHGMYNFVEDVVAGKELVFVH